VPSLAASIIAQAPNVVQQLSDYELDSDALAAYADIIRRRAERFAA
jgi:hypothetical protein